MRKFCCLLESLDALNYTIGIGKPPSEGRAMKRIFIFLFFLLIVFSCETGNQGTKLLSATPKPGSQLLGGFKPISLDNELVKKARNYLILEKEQDYPQVISFRVVDAFSQVVAGTNIKLIIDYKLENNSGSFQAMAIIGFDLQGNPTEIRELVENFKPSS